MHMSKSDKNGIQPPLELVRSIVDYGGWYNENFEFQKLKKVNFIAALTTGIQHRTNPAQFSRASRHFNLFQWSDPDATVFKDIFSTIMTWYVESLDLRPDKLDKIKPLCTGVVVDATIHVYSEMLKNVLPAPTKPLHIFNPRDIGAVVQGMVLLRGNQIRGPHTIVRLWTHEVLRVFFDRLSSEKDIDWALAMIKDTTTKMFNRDFDLLFSHLDKDHSNTVEPDELRLLYFGSFLNNGNYEYEEIENTEDIIPCFEKHLLDYNKSLRSLWTWSYLVTLLNICRAWYEF